MLAAFFAVAALCGAANPDGTAWTAKDVPHDVGALYALSWRATPRGPGLLNGGPPKYNMDFPVKAGETNEQFLSVVYPAEAASLSLRLGTWEMPGGASWRDASCRRVLAEYNALPCGIVLGAGEAVDGNVYRFRRRNCKIQGPHVRPFRRRAGGSFNSGVWRVYPGTGCDYEFEVKGRRFLDFSVSVPSDLKTGSAAVEASADGRAWHEVAVCRGRGAASGRLPDGVLPAVRVFVRIRGGDGCSGTVGYPAVTARFDGEPLRAAGCTRYVDAETGALAGEVRAPDYYDDGWGKAIGVAAPGFEIWRADEEMRVAPFRAVPKEKSRGLSVSAAANEAEAVQLVVKAGAREVRGVSVRPAGDLVAGGGAAIPSSAVDVRQVTFLDIEHPTDETSSPGLWPEPLEPIPPSGVTVPAGENRSFWIRVKVPKGAAPGRYAGWLAVSSSGEDDVRVPFGVEVFGFELPEVMTLKTSFGYTQSRVYDYHRARPGSERSKVNESYLDALSQAHLSPYHPEYGVAAQWTYRVVEPSGESGAVGVEFDWASWDAGMERILSRWRFNTFVFTIPGFTSGSFPKDGSPHVFHGRREGTPEYDALAGKYLAGIESHLRERGWLDVAYLYWYDEPTSNKFPWLERGLSTVRRFAPGIRRMITKEPNEGLFGGVNLWCPTPDNLSTPLTAKCRARGDEFWWYVCMQPRAPYATLFIDHPGTDLRVWLWQTWKARVSGILVWETVYWTSKSAYPDSRQNPYEDAASWADSIRYNWGNGDGRFLYPPRACFDEGKNPVLQPPNGSMRLEILRDGIEDYEYFAILSRLDPKNPLLEVPAEVSESLVRFTVRPEPIKAHRRKMAREIERLLKRAGR